MVLKLGLESDPRREVTLPLVEDMTNMSGERHKAEQMLAEEPLPLLRSALGEQATGCGQLDRTVLELGELEDVKSLGNREEVADVQGERAADPGQLGMPFVRRQNQRLGEPAEPIDAVAREVRIE